MDAEIGQARADDLTTLHHPVRRRMLEFLNINGPSTVGAIAAGTACTTRMRRLTVAAPYPPATTTHSRKNTSTGSRSSPPATRPHTSPATRKPL